MRTRVAPDPRQWITAPLDAVDDAVGAGIDAAMTAHHRGRLARHGQHAVLDAGSSGPMAEGTWWVEGPPVREGNHVEVLVDGADVVSRITDLMRGARRSVLMASWHASPDFAMDAGGSLVLRDLLAETAARVPVRMLMWAGAPVPVFQPTRPHVAKDREAFLRDSALDLRLDRRERPMHCHHEKLVVVDDEVAVVGGVDLTHLEGNRFDDPRHRKTDSLGWHDAAMVVRGPLVADVANHIVGRWNDVTGESLPEVAPGGPAGSTALQLLRTVPEGVYDFLPHGEFSNLAGYLTALRQARHLVYLENQFLWSPEVVDVLIDKLKRPPSPDFRLVLVLPLRPSSGKDTTCGELARLIAADAGRGHLLATTLLGPTAASTGVYVHAKVAVVDDHWLTIGSANLNEHSLFNDTEVNVLVQDPELARQTRLRLWSEHLALPVEAIDGPAHQVVDTIWKAQCDEEGPISAQHRDPVHRIRRIDGLSRRVDRLKGPLMSLAVDG